MASQKQEELGGGLGVRIDALEEALVAFDPHELDSLIALRRQIQFAREEAERAGLAEIARAAGPAAGAGVLDVRGLVAGLLSVMRHTALRFRIDMSAGSGGGGLLVSEDFFADLLRTLAGGGRHGPAGVASVRIKTMEEVTRLHGTAAARGLAGLIGRILAGSVRTGDYVAQVAPDEFGLLFPGEDAGGFAAALHRIESAFPGRRLLALPDGSSVPAEVSVAGQMLNQDEAAGRQPAAEETPAGACIGILSRHGATAKVIESRLKDDGFVVRRADADTFREAFGERRLQAVLVDEPPRGLTDILPALRKTLARRRTPILVLVTDEEEARTALALGATEPLQRPVDLDRLVEIVRRQVRIRRQPPSRRESGRDSRFLVASNDVYHLIALGSALHKQARCEVILGRGGQDAVLQIKRHAPATIILDFRLRHEETQTLLQHVATLRPEPDVLLIIEEDEQRHAATILTPRIAGVLQKPVRLLGLAAQVTRLTGRAAPDDAPADAPADAAPFQAQIARIMQAIGP